MPSKQSLRTGWRPLAHQRLKVLRERLPGVEVPPAEPHIGRSGAALAPGLNGQRGCVREDAKILLCEAIQFVRHFADPVVFGLVAHVYPSSPGCPGFFRWVELCSQPHSCATTYMPSVLRCVRNGLQSAANDSRPHRHIQVRAESVHVPSEPPATVPRGGCTSFVRHPLSQDGDQTSRKVLLRPTSAINVDLRGGMMRRCTERPHPVGAVSEET